MGMHRCVAEPDALFALYETIKGETVTAILKDHGHYVVFTAPKAAPKPAAKPAAKASTAAKRRETR